MAIDSGTVLAHEEQQVHDLLKIIIATIHSHHQVPVIASAAAAAEETESVSPHPGLGRYTRAREDTMELKSPFSSLL